MGTASAGGRMRITRLLLWVVLPALAAFAGLMIWRRLEESYPVAGLERSRETQRLINLWLYTKRGKSGSLLPQGDTQLAIREGFLQDVLSRSLPIREEFENGRYEARLERARLDLQDGLASITLYGHGRMVGPQASPLEADLALQTHIDVVEFRPGVGTLRAGLAVTRVHVIRAGRGTAGFFMNPVVRYFSGLKVEDWNRQRPSLEIPIRLDQEIKLPAIQGDVSLGARTVPISVHVSALTAIQNRVVLSLALGREAAFGERPRGSTADRIELTAGLRTRAEASVRDLYRGGRVAAERERLLKRVYGLAGDDPLWKGILESGSDVVAIVPQPVLQVLCDRIAQSYLQGARLDFDPDVSAHLDKPIQAKFLGKRVGAGRVYGNLEVTHLRGQLSAAGRPKLKLLPPDALELATPVRVTKGEGRVKISMRWDPKFLVSIVCRGFGFQERLTGEVLPFSHVLSTRIQFAPERSTITGRPVVRRDRFSVPCEFSPASLGKVRAALEEQDRFLRCGIGMDADTVLANLRQLVRRDIRIRLPKTLFKPFSLPVRLEREYEAGEFHIAARAENPEVAVRPGYLRFGFGAVLRVRPAASTGSAGSRGGTSRPKDVGPGEVSGPAERRSGASRD